MVEQVRDHHEERGRAQVHAGIGDGSRKVGLSASARPRKYQPAARFSGEVARRFARRLEPAAFAVATPGDEVAEREARERPQVADPLQAGAAGVILFVENAIAGLGLPKPGMVDGPLAANEARPSAERAGRAAGLLRSCG